MEIRRRSSVSIPNGLGLWAFVCVSKTKRGRFEIAKFAAENRRSAGFMRSWSSSRQRSVGKVNLFDYDVYAPILYFIVFGNVHFDFVWSWWNACSFFSV